MNWFKDLKIKNKLSFASIFCIALLVFMSVFSSLQLFHINKNYSDLLDSSIGRQSSLSKAIADMNRLYYINLTKGYLVTINAGADYVSALEDNYNKYAALLIGNLMAYRRFVAADNYLTEAERQERFNILNRIVYLFTNDYQTRAAELDASLYVDNQATYRIIGETMLIGDRISLELDTLYSLMSAKAEKVSATTTASSQRTILLLSATVVSLIILAALFFFLLSKTIKEPLAQMEKAMLEISKGNLTYPIRNDRHDELGILANQIGDMVDSISEMNKVVTIMENLDSMVIVTDLDYNLIYINRSLAEAYGLNIEKYKGQKCYAALKSLDQPCSICQLPHLFPEKDSFPVQNYEFLYDATLGAWLSGTAAIIRWVDGSMVFMQSIQDETEKMENRERLREAMVAAEAASEAKSAFLANMSHEIRTPMNAVLGMSELLLQENLNERQFRYASDIKTSALSLLDIINDILDTSKMQAGKLQLIPVHYDFNTLIDNISSMTQFLAEDKGIGFRLTMDEQTSVCLYGDDVRLRQVLWNLLGNAVKFTEEGYIQLAVNLTDTAVEFTVSDTGPGIPALSIPTLFDAFEQADIRANRGKQGTGLGLTITKAIVEMMGGQIKVESVYGEGASFYITIPTVLGDPSLIHHTDTNESAIYAPTAQILVVDDNAVNLHVASGLLHLCKIEAETASSGKQALEMLQHKQYDLVFMDQRMPGMSGVETTEAIRALGINTPIIALTASVIVGAKEMMLEAGMNDYLSKPIIKAELQHILKKWLPAEKLLDPPPETLDRNPAEEEGYQEFWRRIAQINGLSMLLGLERVDGQRDIYKKTLKLTIQEIEKSDKNLPEFLSAGDLKNFRIEVHGLKGSLANIGAMDLSAQAYDLEMAATNRSAEFCEDNLPGLIEGINNLHLELKEAFSVINQNNGPLTIPSEVPPIFHRMQEAFREMDLLRIDSEIENLNALNLSSALKEEIEQLKDSVMMMDYDGATECMQKLLMESNA